MEDFDLHRLFGRAIRSKHFIEAVALGYQMLEHAVVVLLTKTNVGSAGKPIDDSRIEKLRYLREKAEFARDQGFMPDAVYSQLDEFNRRRNQIIHNMVKKKVTYDEVESCARMVDPIYMEIQKLFLKITFGEIEDV